MGRRQPGTLQVLLPDVPVPPFTKALDLKHVNIWFGSGTIHNPAHYDAVRGVRLWGCVVWTWRRRSFTV